MKLFHSALLGLATVAVIACTSANASTEDRICNELRAPAYPLVTIDPYTSAWSMTDNLYDSQVSHWTRHDFPLIGVVKVDGTPYRFMGVEKPELRVIVPTSEQGNWTANYTTSDPGKGWAEVDFNDSAWQNAPGSFGTKKLESTAVTEWGEPQIWVRRAVEVNEDLAGRDLYLEYSNDDDAEFYINGKLVHYTGMICNKNKQVKLSEEDAALLHQGTNLIAVKCNNPVANGLLDFGILTPISPEQLLDLTAEQTSVDVQPMQTYYTFKAGSVDVDLTFTAPLFLDNLDLISRPVNYVTYGVKSNDGAKHDVSFYFEASPRWALHADGQAATTETYEKDGLIYFKAGSQSQNVLNRAGDHTRIDWGYFYMATPKDKNTTAAVAATDQTRGAFVNGSSVETNAAPDEACNMSFVRSMGNVKDASAMFMIGYDDLYSIQYFGDNLRPYWNREENQTIEGQFAAANSDYKKLMKQATAFDRKFMEDYTAAGGIEYAEICALAYRQAIAAHKLVVSPKGELLLFSKENDSNGSIGTVDITYPTAPIFLYYNPELVKATMNHIFEYSESGRWDRPFAAHDVGTYPKANGQTYGGDMPVEESGNMLILCAAIAKEEGNADYAAKHWDVLTTWTDYLVENGLNPENQLCTDDFAGHFAHNTNLSIKAILGIASYSRLADMLGKKDVADKYMGIAKDYAAQWEQMANAGDHYGLTFDKPETWSQKYNIVWDRMLDFNIFDEKIVPTEIAYYLANQNQYGLPLDNRRTYSKSDWIMWTATLDGNDDTFAALIKPLHKFYNETTDRVPMSDWIYTDSPTRSGFMTRAVVGGYWIKALDKKNSK